MKQTSKKLLSWLLTLTMVLSMVPAMTLTAAAADTTFGAIKESIALPEDVILPNVDDATTVTAVTSDMINWSEGWYVVNDTVNIGSTVFLKGDVNLILTDGCTFNSKQIAGTGGTDFKLTIWGQTNGTGTLNAKVTTSSAAVSVGMLYIHGGTVKLETSNAGFACLTITDNSNPFVIDGGTVTINSAGTGVRTNGGVTIKGGKVNITAGGSGIAIGPGGVSGKDLTISGGDVFISGNNIASEERLNAITIDQPTSPALQRVVLSSTNKDGTGAVVTDKGTDWKTTLADKKFVIITDKPLFDLRDGSGISTTKPKLNVGDTDDSRGYTFAGWYTKPDGAGEAMDGDGDIGTIYYAKWTKDDKTVLTQPIEVSSSNVLSIGGKVVKTSDPGANDYPMTADQVTTAYGISLKVEGSAPVLTLNGTVIDIFDGSINAVKLNGDATIHVPESTQATIVSRGSAGSQKLIDSTASLTLTGGGTLNVDASRVTGSGLVAMNVIAKLFNGTSSAAPVTLNLSVPKGSSHYALRNVTTLETRGAITASGQVSVSGPLMLHEDVSISSDTSIIGTITIVNNTPVTVSGAKDNKDGIYESGAGWATYTAKSGGRVIMSTGSEVTVTVNGTPNDAKTLEAAVALTDANTVVTLNRAPAAFAEAKNLPANVTIKTKGETPALTIKNSNGAQIAVSGGKLVLTLGEGKSVDLNGATYTGTADSATLSVDPTSGAVAVTSGSDKLAITLPKNEIPAGGYTLPKDVPVTVGEYTYTAKNDGIVLMPNASGEPIIVQPENTTLSIKKGNKDVDYTTPNASGTFNTVFSVDGDSDKVRFTSVADPEKTNTDGKSGLIVGAGETVTVDGVTYTVKGTPNTSPAIVCYGNPNTVVDAENLAGMSLTADDLPYTLLPGVPTTMGDYTYTADKNNTNDIVIKLNASGEPTIEQPEQSTLNIKKGDKTVTYTTPDNDENAPTVYTMDGGSDKVKFADSGNTAGKSGLSFSDEQPYTVDGVTYTGKGGSTTYNVYYGSEGVNAVEITSDNDSSVTTKFNEAASVKSGADTYTANANAEIVITKNAEGQTVSAGANTTIAPVSGQTNAFTATYTAPSNPSGGGSSAPAITVPVSGDEHSINVSATVSGSTATVNIKDADIEKITHADANTGVVEIDLTGLKQDVDTVKIPTKTVEKIADAVAEHGNDTEGVSVKLSNATVTFDGTATQAISEQAKGNTIEIKVDEADKKTLTAEQKSSIEGLGSQIVIEATVISNGHKISDFKGGSAEVSVPYTLKNGQKANGLVVFFVADDGSVEKVPATYVDGNVVFTVKHFSHYVVAYSAVNAFTDVAEGAYYYDAVKWAVENGITDGTSATTFSPNGITTRAQVVTFLWRAAGCPTPKGNASKFTDIVAGEYYETAVAWAVENGITNGATATTFSPDAKCTRGQIVTFLYRYNGMDTMNIKDNPFSDVPAGKFYYDAVLWAAENGITSGTTATTFSPVGSCTRGQTVTFLYRLLNK